MRFETELDAVLDEIVTRWGIPGMAAGVVEGSNIVHTRCFGVQSMETMAPVTPDSIFCVASISKVFVATAVMQLSEHGIINLDAPVVQYLPDFRMDDPRYREITIRHMLSHTSGMPDMDEVEYHDLVNHSERDDRAAERYIQTISHRKLIANPGERFHYSNIAYNALGYMIAQVSGQPFKSVMKEQVLIPSGMLHSTFLL